MNITIHSYIIGIVRCCYCINDISVATFYTNSCICGNNINIICSCIISIYPCEIKSINVTTYFKFVIRPHHFVILREDSFPFQLFIQIKREKPIFRVFYIISQVFKRHNDFVHIVTAAYNIIDFSEVYFTNIVCELQCSQETTIVESIILDKSQMVWQTDVFGMAVVKCASVDVDYIFVLIIFIDIIRNVNRVSLFRREKRK